MLQVSGVEVRIKGSPDMLQIGGVGIGIKGSQRDAAG